ncbi:putative glutathione-specific gamma-glutamylcyclotransferase 2 [Condylostylus longicornis]|uniref:putative glutathione-specific gamma-glutamylcyclotransferase 2 n=1 Tax=Condylostylus longicornis TaxID=2530218 RepID=UPI00244DDC29|nr:putative glutathione-specific gamma-glutamylcyclotransferase 2 [Condylostylus longicornis]
MDLRKLFYDDSDSDSEHSVADNLKGIGNLEINNNGNDENITCWIFGYGSLCWNPGFTYTKCVTGYIRGFVRRFWQGSISHRGTPDKPGRVATLCAEKEGITWGCAYKITGRTALEYLKQRECTIGGYVTLDSKFFPRVATCDTEFRGEAFPVLVYIATDQNSLWVGDLPIQSIAEQISESSGASGHNVEYVIRLADFMREEIPNETDDHLFDLEHRIIQILIKRNTPIHSLMGIPPERIRRDSHANIERPTTFEFASRVPDKKLRCLNV